MAKKADTLAAYRKKRDFSLTPEPSDNGAMGAPAASAALRFVVQKHWASRLHYDFRLELDGAMKSWAVPKGPSYDPADKRMAVQVEDHPIAYNEFEGQIPAKQYGAGKVIIWDKGVWEPLEDPVAGYRQGKLKFALHGHKLQGRWTLVRMHGRGQEKQPPWLLIKEHDGLERPAAEFNLVDALPDSVKHLPDAPAPAAPSPSIKPPTKKARASRTPKAVLPAQLAPQLATLVEAPPTDPADWQFELKFDGYRMLARIGKKNAVHLYTRNGNDWAARMPTLVAALQTLPTQSSWLDGEVVVLDAQGRPDFQALQNAFDEASTADLVYYLFDAPFLDGHDLRSLPLTERRARLHALLTGHPDDHIRFSEAFDAAPQDLVASACKIGFEGVIGKRKDGTYVSRRSPDWIKLKCGHRQEFVIGGYTDPKGSRTGLGSLLLGVHDDTGALRYAGNVGSGFNERVLSDLRHQLEGLHTEASPFANAHAIPHHAHWVRPALLAEVAFADWTHEQRIRHAVFRGLRDDKPASAIVREHPRPASTKASNTARPPALSASVQVTHPERVIDPSTGTTKLDLVRYYAKVAPLMMEHLQHRPVSLVRAPSGIGGELFFQRHQDRGVLPGVRQLDPALYEDHAPLLEVAREEGVLSAAQMNVIELHTWNARRDRIDRPDRMTFDLDPGSGVAWAQMQEAAELVRVLLGELGLPTYLKTSGGKGLHVVVPVKRLNDWDTVKGFSQAIVAHLARTIPQRFVVKSGPRNRVGKIFVDYLRNGFGATTVAAWSARARPGLGISVPIAWTELAGLESSAQWTVQNVDSRLRLGNTPWKGYDRAAVSIGPAMQLLGDAPQD